MNAYVIYTVGLAAALAWSPAPFGETNFAGTWTPASVQASPAGRGVAGLPPSDLVITQTPTELSIARTAFDQVITTRYFLDGRESTNRSGAMTKITRARWNGARLVVEGKASQVTSQGYAAWTIAETYSRDANGRLVIDSASTADDGQQTKGRQIYTKKAGS